MAIPKEGNYEVCPTLLSQSPNKRKLRPWESTVNTGVQT